jgi:hypothetical protein
VGKTLDDRGAARIAFVAHAAFCRVCFRFLNPEARRDALCLHVAPECRTERQVAAGWGCDEGILLATRGT